MSGKVDYSKVVSKFAKYVVAGIASAGALTYTTGSVPVELQVLVASVLLALYNAVKHEWDLDLP